MRLLDVRPFVCTGLLALVGGGCAGNSLHEYDYRSATLAVASDIPFRPRVLSGSTFDLRPSGDLLQDVVRAGSRVVLEIEQREVAARLDEASEKVDVGYVLEDNTLERAARFMGADAAPDEPDPDYLLELIVVDYGINAENWNATAYFYIEADAALLHAPSGTEIWRVEIGATEGIGPGVYGAPREVTDLLTAAMLTTLSVDEMVRVLEGLADFSARIVTDRLRDDLRDARRR